MVKLKDKSTEQKILDAAKQVFITQGMSGARMQDIADAAALIRLYCIIISAAKKNCLKPFFQKHWKNFFQSLRPFWNQIKQFLKKLK